MSAYLSDKDYEFIFSRVPRLTIDLVINKDNGIILTRRNIPPHMGKWHLPGGRLFMREKV
jgi:ADP-ribose pyrophosphatase YjhB (NUDIX family)